jgi:hypothetical protein
MWIDGPVLDGMSDLARELSAKVGHMLAEYPEPVALAIAWRAVGCWIDNADGCRQASESLVEAMVQREVAMARAQEPADNVIVACTMPPPRGIQ